MSVTTADEAEIRDGSVPWMLSLGFRLVGAWDGTMSRIHHAPFLHCRPGVYAFVVDGRVAYIGKASKLHSRLRNYRSRVLKPRESRPLREAHKRIIEAAAARWIVNVYALPIEPDDSRTPKGVEADLIRRARPEWNGNGWDRCERIG